jgi:DNA-binding NarL/FixJ family response regulator
VIARCVLVVDHHEVVRIGLRTLLTRLDWVTRCVGAGNGSDALELTERYEPHVAIVDLCVGEESGLDICRALRAARPAMKVLLMSETGLLAPDLARGAGAQGHVAKDWNAGMMAEAVRMAAEGRAVFAPYVDHRLSPREREVLAHLARGLSNTEVAIVLNLSHHTVKQHISAVYKKLSVRNRAEAASHAQRLGLVA